VVLISGSGTNLDALVTSLPSSGIPTEVVAVGSDKDASGLEHASRRGIPTFVVAPGEFYDTDAWGEALGDAIASFAPDWIILSVVGRFSPKILNTHPSYLPEFPGAHGVADALAAGVEETGASVIVVDDGVDSGPIIARRRVPIHPGDTEASLHERIKIVERELLLEVLGQVISNQEGDSAQ
jgi:phosphoribosylglycinamide formyltransferase-1